MKEKIKVRKELITQMLKGKPPRSLNWCDEDTLRDYVGWHRILPKQLRTDLLLGRAFRKRGIQSQEDSLYDLLENDLIQKGEDIHDYLFSGLSSESSEEKESSSDEDKWNAFINEYKIMARKISILECVKDIFSKKKDQVAQETSKCDNEMVEQKRFSHKKNLNELQSPQFDRLQRDLLHDMHVERRPLSWFNQRCKYFHAKAERKPVEAGKVKLPEKVADKPTQVNKVNRVMKEAVKELLVIQRSRIYDNYYMPEDVILEKLVILMKKISNNMKKIKESDEKSADSGLASTPNDEVVGHTKDEYSSSEEESCSIKDEKKDVDTFVSKGILSQVGNIVKEILASVEEIECDHVEVLRQLKKIIELFKIRRIGTEELPKICFGNKPDEKQKTRYSIMQKIQFLPVVSIFLSTQFPMFAIVHLSSHHQEVIHDSSLVLCHNYVGDSLPRTKVWCKIFSVTSLLEVFERLLILQQRVKVMSGGRVGLEPLYSEYVARGMLDCVVLGNKVNGPAINTILQAIIHIAGDEGVVIIIMNDFQYRFRFLRAAAKAKKMGIDTSVVLAQDDAKKAVESEPPLAGGRPGSAGIVLLYKVASAMAAEGHTITAITRTCQFLCMDSLSCYTSPEGGYGPESISGPRPVVEARTVGRELLSALLRFYSPSPGSTLILLLNNQDMSYEEIFRIVMDVSEVLMSLKVKLERVYIGHFIALSGKGFTLTLAQNRNEGLQKYLDIPTTCNLWPPHASSGDWSKISTKRPLGPLTGAQVMPYHKDIILGVFESFSRGIQGFAAECPAVSGEQAGQLEVLASVMRFLYEENEAMMKHPFPLLVAIGESLEAVEGFGEELALVLYAGAQEFWDSEAAVSWLMFVNALYRGACALAEYTRHVPGDGSHSDFLLPLATAIYNTGSGMSPLWVMRKSLDDLKHILALHNENPGIQFCGHVFNMLLRIFEKSFCDYPLESWNVVETDQREFL